MKRSQLRAFIQAVLNTRTILTNEQASEVPSLFPSWDGDSVNYIAGKRVIYNNKLYTVLQNHTSQSGWTPTDAPSLFAEVLAGQGGTDIGEWVQPDSTNPYMTGDRVMFNGEVWESLIDNNVWSPAAYPAGWKKIE